MSKRHQTKTEPDHIHKPKSTSMGRLPNFHHKDLHSILEFIYLYSIVKESIDSDGAI
ncbi:hypothetical protein HNQ94_000014 [Salirhabdus euzebyi]|uniref:Uncharacterized protein n=1 Tax=Salirhabdus euzebyi TaxID=394506 RepID=A0A841Q0Y9_9BACI|nr:hypothetical protein [Salirhabdus euzebyi]MBB6451593.1 hypothetical protein [Salirhabdus euzebyi]